MVLKLQPMSSSSSRNQNSSAGCEKAQEYVSDWTEDIIAVKKNLSKDLFQEENQLKNQKLPVKAFFRQVQPINLGNMFSDDSATEEGVVAGESEKNSIYASTILEKMEDDEEKNATESVETEDDLMDDNV